MDKEEKQTKTEDIDTETLEETYQELIKYSDYEAQMLAAIIMEELEKRKKLIC